MIVLRYVKITDGISKKKKLEHSESVCKTQSKSSGGIDDCLLLLMGCLNCDLCAQGSGGAGNNINERIKSLI